MPVKITVTHQGKITREIDLEPGERYPIPFYDPCETFRASEAKVAVIGCPDSDWGVETHIIGAGEITIEMGRIVVAEEVLTDDRRQTFSFGGRFEIPILPSPDSETLAVLSAQHTGAQATLISSN